MKVLLLEDHAALRELVAAPPETVELEMEDAVAAVAAKAVLGRQDVFVRQVVTLFEVIARNFHRHSERSYSHLPC